MICAGKNGEYSLTRDVDEAFSRALADMSKPYTDLKDDSLVQFQSQSRLPDGVAGLNDEELMKHLTSLLFCRNATSPVEEFVDNMGELGGGLAVSDLRGITHALSSSSAWGIASSDCDGLTGVTGETKLDIETACLCKGIVDPHADVTASTVSSVISDSGISSLPLPLMHSSAALTVTVTGQSVPSSLPSFTVAVCSCVSAQRTLEASTALSKSADVGTLILDSLLTAPELQAGSLPAVPCSLLVSSTSTASLPSGGPSSLPALPDVQTLMRPSWRYVIDSRPMVTSGLSALPLASIFTPFSTAFCPPPPVSSSSVVKMDHPLASSAVLSAVAATSSCSHSTVCSPSLTDSALSSVVPPVPLVHIAADQPVLLPTSLSGSSIVSHQPSMPGT